MGVETAGRGLYLDDLAVGAEFRSADHRLDADQIIAFASEFDPQPFHIDPVAAQNTFFRGLAASGWHSAAIAMKLLVESLPLADGVIGTGVEVAWSSPVRPDETLHVVSTIREILPSRSKPHQAIVVLESRLFNQDYLLKQTVTSKILVFKRRVEGEA
jgi:acyl dehydratase